jgi:hypothetical protein
MHLNGPVWRLELATVEWPERAPAQPGRRYLGRLCPRGGTALAGGLGRCAEDGPLAKQTAAPVGRRV